ncbi:MAG: transglycosylase family protein [Acidimicrobiales bacterium]
MRTRRRTAAFAASLFLAASPLVADLFQGSTVAEAHAVASFEPDTLQQNLADLRWCESNDDYGIDTGNGYYGAYQFDPETWWWLGYEGWPHEAAPEVQDEAAIALLEIYGWSPWPACSAWLGLY